MKDKGLYFIIGLLVGAILTTGVFMLINKNNSNSNNNRSGNNGNGQIYNGDRQPPTQEELDAMEKTILEDGTIQYQSPDGSRVMRRVAPGVGQ